VRAERAPSVIGRSEHRTRNGQALGRRDRPALTRASVRPGGSEAGVRALDERALELGRGAEDTEDDSVRRRSAGGVSAPSAVFARRRMRATLML
jgi:hypothetical protein